MSCLLQLVTHTRSESTNVSILTPLRTRHSAHHEPTPPNPNISTFVLAMLSETSFPNKSSVRRCAPRSNVDIIYIFIVIQPRNRPSCREGSCCLYIYLLFHNTKLLVLISTRKIFSSNPPSFDPNRSLDLKRSNNVLTISLVRADERLELKESCRSLCIFEQQKTAVSEDCFMRLPCRTT